MSNVFFKLYKVEPLIKQYPLLPIVSPLIAIQTLLGGGDKNNVQKIVFI